MSRRWQLLMSSDVYQKNNDGFVAGSDSFENVNNQWG